MNSATDDSAYSSSTPSTVYLYSGSEWSASEIDSEEEFLHDLDIVRRRLDFLEISDPYEWFYLHFSFILTTAHFCKQISLNFE